MTKKVDVAIIGGGPAAIYAAYEFVLKYPKVSVLILEEGHAIDLRNCPIIAGKVEKCIRCTPCSIMRGFGGAGAFSDGKYNFTTEFGGWLSDYIPKKTVMELIDYVDEINLKHGAPGEVYSTKNCKIGREALGHDLHLLNAKVRHLGTDNNRKLMASIYRFLMDHGIQIQCDTQVKTFKPCDGGYEVFLKDSDETVKCTYLIGAPGRCRMVLGSVRSPGPGSDQQSGGCGRPGGSAGGGVPAHHR